MGLTETSASAFKKMPGCLDGWPSHVLVLGLSTTSTTGWADIFRWLVSLVDNSAQPNGPQRGVRFLVHLFSVLAGGQCILGGALATYCLHTVLCEVGPDLPWPYLLLLCSQDVALRRLQHKLEELRECLWWRITLQTTTDRPDRLTHQTFVLVKTYWRRLQYNIFLSFKTYFFKT